MYLDKKTIYFDHEGDFEILVEDEALEVDMQLIQKIVFTDHENKIRYLFSKFRTEMIDDDLIQIDNTGLQSN
ncbi:hypothetical protein [Nitrosopumilus sp.]|uniref:hypothetical protein n=1 Tax=Nitrosopumilus sp. TaxID=2024843 RepID=UPI0026167C0F|nr:hypothetical protein [Nitrosopumilus sp.]